MRKLYNNKEITHFLYLEDDILIDKNNLNYWINSRKVLKRFNLIPGFIRTEVNQNDNELYAIDFVKKDKLKYLPKIKINQNYFFKSQISISRYVFVRQGINERAFVWTIK